MLAEVFERHVGQDVVGEDRVGRAREKNLAAMTSRADPGGAMIGQSDVPIPRRGRLTGVHTHSHLGAHVSGPCMVCERPLSRECRSDRILRTREDGQKASPCVSTSRPHESENASRRSR
jgi:hypothetical protein